jgi:hypothetical protein
MSERLTEEDIGTIETTQRDRRAFWQGRAMPVATRCDLNTIDALLADRAAQQAEITRLVARVGELEAALRPFEDMYDRYQRGTHWSDPYLYDNMVEPIRAAAQALANGEQAR